MKSKRNIEITPEIVQELRGGNIISAIELLREKNQLGLKDAKQIMDAMLAQGFHKTDNEVKPTRVHGVRPSDLHRPTVLGTDNDSPVQRHPDSSGLRGALIKLFVLGFFAVVAYLIFVGDG